MAVLGLIRLGDKYGKARVPGELITPLKSLEILEADKKFSIRHITQS